MSSFACTWTVFHALSNRLGKRPERSVLLNSFLFLCTRYSLAYKSSTLRVQAALWPHFLLLHVSGNFHNPHGPTPVFISQPSMASWKYTCLFFVRQTLRMSSLQSERCFCAAELKCKKKKKANEKNETSFFSKVIRCTLDKCKELVIFKNRFPIKYSILESLSPFRAKR